MPDEEKEHNRPAGFFIPAWALGSAIVLLIYGLTSFQGYVKLQVLFGELQNKHIALAKKHKEDLEDLKVQHKSDIEVVIKTHESDKSAQWRVISEMQKVVNKDKISVLKNDLEHLQIDVGELKNYHKTYRTKNIP